MAKLAARRKRAKRTVKIGEADLAAAELVEDLDGCIEAIQCLIPLELEAVT